MNGIIKQRSDKQIQLIWYMQRESFSESGSETNLTLRVVRDELFNIQNVLLSAHINLPHRNLLRECLSATSELTTEGESTRLQLMAFRSKLQTLLQVCETELASG
jgi:hypothetical protein